MRSTRLAGIRRVFTRGREAATADLAYRPVHNARDTYDAGRCAGTSGAHMPARHKQVGRT